MISRIFNADNIRIVVFLATLVGAMWTLTSRLEDRLTQRIDRLEDKMDARFDKVDARFERIETRLDSFGERIAKNEARLDDAE